VTADEITRKVREALEDLEKFREIADVREEVEKKIQRLLDARDVILANRETT